MRKFIAGLLTLSFLFALSGCKTPAGNKDEETPVSSYGETVPSYAEEEFEASYYRADLFGTSEDRYPISVSIKSADELKTYYDSHKDIYQVDQQYGGEKSMASDIFLNESKYGEDFFADKFLVFVLLKESSGSNRHNVSSVRLDGDKLKVNISRIIPNVGTDDMAYWYVVLALDKELSDKEVTVDIKDERMS